jgi:hypothetical protein
MGSQSQSEGDGAPSCDNDFEAARLGVSATPGSPQALPKPDLQLRNPDLTEVQFFSYLFEKRQIDDL